MGWFRPSWLLARAHMIERRGHDQRRGEKIMKLGLCAVVLALTMTSAATAEQAKPREKGKPPATKEQAPGSSSASQCSPDTTAPVIASVTATPGSLGAPNHKMTPVSITA